MTSHQKRSQSYSNLAVLTLVSLFIALGTPVRAQTKRNDSTRNTSARESELSAAPKVNYLILTRSGIDSAGRSADERFELTADGLLKWRVSGTADGNDLASCDTLGGRFQKRISSNEAVKLAKLALAAAESQPSPSDEPRSGRDITLSLTASYGDKVVSKTVEASTSEYQELMSSINRLKLALDPQSVVQMKAKAKGKSLDVEFNLTGTDPMKVFFPPDANEIFQLNGRSNGQLGGQKLSYVKKPARHEIELTPKKPKFVIKLKVEKDLAKAKRLNYSNALVLHHQKPEGKFGLPPQALNLCSSL